MSAAAAPAWTARVLTIFPEMFPGPLAHSLAGKALSEGVWALEAIDIRDFAITSAGIEVAPAGRHRRAGGAGPRTPRRRRRRPA